MSRSLDLGSGSRPRNPFTADEVFGVDLIASIDNSNVKFADLAVDPIPYPDEHFDYVTAYDFIEHIPRVIYAPSRRNCFVELMNEVYRVLKFGGIFLSYTPAFPHAAAFVDPTHVNIITEGTFPLYFADGHCDSPWGGLYGFKGRFKMLSQEFAGPHLMSVLQKSFVVEDSASAK